MIISQQYFKKCQKAFDLQESKLQYDDGDYFVISKSIKKTDDKILCTLINSNSFKTKVLSEVWIPTIQQLIEYHQHNFFNAKQFFVYLYSFTFFIKNKENSFKTVEEQLLAFHMYQTHKKRWIEKEEEWVAEVKKETLNDDNIIFVYDEIQKKLVEKTL